MSIADDHERGFNSGSPARAADRSPADQQARRKVRLAAELRANLSKRKTQARGKAQSDDGEAG